MQAWSFRHCNQPAKVSELIARPIGGFHIPFSAFGGFSDSIRECFAVSMPSECFSEFGHPLLADSPEVIAFSSALVGRPRSIVMTVVMGEVPSEIAFPVKWELPVPADGPLR